MMPVFQELARLGIHPRARYTVKDTIAARAMVSAGLGVTIVNSLHSRMLITPGQPAVSDASSASGSPAVPGTPASPGSSITVLRPDQPTTVEIGCAMTPRAMQSPAVRRFADFALEKLRGSEARSSR